jgi:hypothetical protein
LINYSKVNILIMKTKFLFFSLLSGYSALGQANSNQSITAVNPAITQPIPAFGSEIFRYRAGLVTQLDFGNNFDLSPTSPLNSRWFSIGSLNTGSQTVYGLRFQDRNKGVVFGYEDIANPNPRIQWIGTGMGLGNFEFRVANSFNSTLSPLVATMTNDGNTIFGNSAVAGTGAKVSIENTGQLGLNVTSSVSPQFTSTGVAASQVSATEQNIGVEVITGTAVSNNGVVIKNGPDKFNIGLLSNTFADEDAIAVLGRTSGDATFEAAIYGETPSNNGNQFAAYFDGETFSTTG